MHFQVKLLVFFVATKIFECACSTYVQRVICFDKSLDAWNGCTAICFNSSGFPSLLRISFNRLTIYFHGNWLRKINANNLTLLSCINKCRLPTTFPIWAKLLWLTCQIQNHNSGLKLNLRWSHDGNPEIQWWKPDYKEMIKICGRMVEQFIWDKMIEN